MFEKKLSVLPPVRNGGSGSVGVAKNWEAYCIKRDFF